jgi:hypothetical protein
MDRLIRYDVRINGWILWEWTFLVWYVAYLMVFAFLSGNTLEALSLSETRDRGGEIDSGRETDRERQRESARAGGRVAGTIAASGP